jgi:hypothetical protein
MSRLTLSTLGRSAIARSGLALAAVGLSLAATMSLASAAERKPMSITVEKRSIFDLGNVVPVGSLNRYAIQSRQASPVYANTGEWYGEGTLPARGFGSSPFANSFSSPRW